MWDYLKNLATAQGIRRLLPSLLRKVLVAVGGIVSLYLGEEAGAAYGQIIEPLIIIIVNGVTVLLAMSWRVAEDKVVKGQAPSTPQVLQ